jgi:lysozyme family protein
MTRAELCIPRTLAHEGGYVNHPSDPGGATNRGITIGTFRRYIKAKGKIADLKAMTQAQAVKVYEAQYWDAVKADQMPFGVDFALFDFAVNSGPARAAMFLQEIVGAAPDGKIGPLTLAAVAKMDAPWVVNELCNDRLTFLRRLSTWSSFGKGWTRRVSDVRAAALMDATAPTVEPVRPDAPRMPTAAPAARTGGLVAVVVAAFAALFSFRKG